jgi:ribonuclease HI
VGGIPAPICISPLGAVPKAGGNLRMILDLRHVNSFLTVPSFRYEGLEAVANVLAPSDYMITLDLHAGYHHVDMNDAALPYLGFAWAGRHYVFQSLPFGLAPAPWAFTTLTRTLLRCWRAAGIKCLGYIDDFLFAAPSADSLLDALHAVILPTLLRAGMLVSWHKCHLTPSRRQVFLGVEIDTTGQGTMRTPGDKATALLAGVRELLRVADSGGRALARNLARVAGQIAAMRWAFGAIVPLFTRGMYSCLGGAPMWESIDLSPWCLSDLQFWATSFSRFNGHTRLWRGFEPDFILHTDAAGTGSDGYQGGWGAVLSLPSGKGTGRATGVFEEARSHENSTVLELDALLHALRTFNARGQLSGRCLRVFSDSQAAVAILAAARAANPKLHALCVSVFTYCIQHDIVFRADWVPREDNVEADALSKRHDTGDWMFSRRLFCILHASPVFGPFEVDLFAAAHNALLPRFYSWGSSLGCEGADALAAASRWHTFNAWAFPPYGLIPRILSLLSTVKARMCLVVPAVPGAAWWPRLVPDGVHFAYPVRAVRVLRWASHPDLLTPGAHNRPMATTPHWPLLALRVDNLSPRGPLVRVPSL